MLAPCATCCVRKGAPERGGARRRCLPFLASFGLSKFWASSTQNDGWKVPSACAAIYARRGAADRLASARITFRDVHFYFFLRLDKPAQPTESTPFRPVLHRTHCSRPRRQSRDEFLRQRFCFLCGDCLALAAVPKAREGLLLRYIRVVSHKHQLLLTPPFTKILSGAVQQPLLGASRARYPLFRCGAGARGLLEAFEDARESASARDSGTASYSVRRRLPRSRLGESA